MCDRQTDRDREGRLTQGEAAFQGGVEAAGVGVDGDVGGGGVPLRVADHHGVDGPPAKHRAHHGNRVVLPGQGRDLERGKVRFESGSGSVPLSEFPRRFTTTTTTTTTTSANVSIHL